MAELTEDYIRMRLINSKVPPHMHDGYVRYLLHGIPPGDFMLAVLTNDLSEACSRADEENQRALYHHVYFLYNYAPRGCWGTRERVERWIEQRQAVARG